jgi:hypothetical protein
MHTHLYGRAIATFLCSHLRAGLADQGCFGLPRSVSICQEAHLKVLKSVTIVAQASRIKVQDIID